MPQPELEARFLIVLRQLAQKLSGEALVWAFTGSVGQALQGLPVKPRDVDIQTDAAGAYRVMDLFPDRVLGPVRFQTTASIRSHYGALKIGGLTVEVMGDVEKRRPDGRWTPPPDLAILRRYVDVDDLRLPVLDLAHEAEAYALLGRHKRAALLRDWLREHPC